MQIKNEPQGAKVEVLNNIKTITIDKRQYETTVKLYQIVCVSKNEIVAVGVEKVRNGGSGWRRVDI